MTDIIEEAVVLWLITNKDKLPKELHHQIDEISRRFFPKTRVDESKVKELLVMMQTLGGVTASIPYAEFLKILGVIDSKEAQEAYDLFRLLVEKLSRLK